MSNICRYFAATGSCYYGDQCNFLHTHFPNRSLPTEPGGNGTGNPLYELESKESSQSLW